MQHSATLKPFPGLTGLSCFQVLIDSPNLEGDIYGGWVLSPLNTRRRSRCRLASIDDYNHATACLVTKVVVLHKEEPLQQQTGDIILHRYLNSSANQISAHRIARENVVAQDKGHRFESMFSAFFWPGNYDICSHVPAIDLEFYDHRWQDHSSLIGTFSEGSELCEDDLQDCVGTFSPAGSLEKVCNILLCFHRHSRLPLVSPCTQFSSCMTWKTIFADLGSVAFLNWVFIFELLVQSWWEQLQSPRSQLSTWWEESCRGRTYRKASCSGLVCWLSSYR